MVEEFYEQPRLLENAFKIAREAERKELEHVSRGTRIIEISSDNKPSEADYPNWYEKPPKINIPPDNLLSAPYTETLFLNGVVFHVKGTKVDYYQGLEVAKVVYCLTGEGPEIVASSPAEKEVRIPLSDTIENYKLVVGLSDSEKKEGEALDENNLARANEITKEREELLANNTEVQLIKEEITKKRIPLSSVRMKHLEELMPNK